jgi:hypothetical protein
LPGAKGEGRQQWMCAAMSGDVKPLNVTLTCNVWAVGSNTTDAEPIPGEAFGGFSFEPARLTTKVIGVASAAGAASMIPLATSIKSRQHRMGSSSLYRIASVVGVATRCIFEASGNLKTKHARE